MGGYEPNKVEKPTEDMVFNGSAVAAVNYWQDEGEIDKSMLTRTDDAKLELIGGKEVLTMNFANASENPWYNVVIDDQFHTADASYIITDDLAYKGYHGFNTSYYGPDGQATEAVVGVHVSAENDMINSTKGIEVDAAFGGKRQ